MEYMLKNVRIAFPALAEKQSVGDGEPAYGAKFIIPPNSPIAAAMDKIMLEVATDKWKDKGPAVLEVLKEKDKVFFLHKPYRNAKTGEPYLGFEGNWSAGARKADMQPTIFDKFGQPVTEKEKIKALIYSGCFVNAKIDIWAQDNQYGRRINASLLGVMFAKDGEAFGGGAPAKQEDFASMAADPSEAMGGAGNSAEDDLVG